MDFIHMTEGYPAVPWIAGAVIIIGIIVGSIMFGLDSHDDVVGLLFGGFTGGLCGAIVAAFIFFFGTEGTGSIGPQVDTAASAEDLAVQIGDVYGLEVSVNDARALMTGVGENSSNYEGEALVTFGEASVLVERDTLVTLELARQDGEWVLFSDGQRLTPSTTTDAGWS